MVLEKTLERPLNSKEIKPVNPKGNQPWIFFVRTDSEVPVLWLPDAKSQHDEKKPDAGKDWGQKKEGTTGDEMAGWHHRLDGCEFEWTPGVGDGQGGVVCCGSWGHKESDTTVQLNWTELNTRTFTDSTTHRHQESQALGYTNTWAYSYENHGK